MGGRGITISIGAAMLLLGITVGALASEREWGLDSLVFNSDAIVEGRFLEPGSGVLRITAVYGGNLKVGQTIKIANPENYRMPAGIARPDTRLGPTDELILFLRRHPGDSPDSFSIDGQRIRIVAAGRVAGFGLPFPNRTSCPRVNDFRNDVRESQAKMSPWRTRFQAPVRKTDVAWLLELLKQSRAEPNWPGMYYVGSPYDGPINEAKKRLIEIGDLSAMERAALVNPYVGDLLQEPFANHAGRVYLLGRLTDRSLPNAQRVKLARAVAYGLSGQTLAATTRPTWWVDPSICDDLAPIAKVASSLARAGDDEIANTLLGTLSDVAEKSSRARDERFEKTLGGVGRILSDLYRENGISE